MPFSVASTAFLTMADVRESLFRSATHFTSSVLRKLMIIFSEAVSISSSVRGHPTDSEVSVYTAVTMPLVALTAVELMGCFTV